MDLMWDSDTTPSSITQYVFQELKAQCEELLETQMS